MKILNKVTLASLRKNKVRTIVTIIGIILSTAMFTAVTTSISSLKNYMVECIIAQNGAWEGQLYGMDDASYQEVMNAEKARLRQAVGIYEIGYMKLDDAVKNGSEALSSKDTQNPYLLFSCMDGDFLDAEELMSFSLLSGRMPENAYEIVIPAELCSNGRQNLKIGDTITGSIGYRMYENELLNSHDWLVQPEEDAAPGVAEEGQEKAEGADEGEQLVTSGKEHTYVIVGMYEYSMEYYACPGYTVFSGASLSEGELLSEGCGIRQAVFAMREPDGIFEFLNRYKAAVINYDYHSRLLYTDGISASSSFSNVYFGLGTILCIIIVFGSVALIYNAFSISVNERIKQFGLLSSIGATKRQLKYSIRFEACAVSLVGIPLGVGAGILGMSITFYALRNRFYGLISSAAVPFSMHVEWWAVLAAAALAFFTVMVSAILPARKAMRISVIEAIRQNGEIRVSRRAVRTPGFLYKLFGMEGGLADKNFRRNRKKYRATVLSLFVSIVLFVSASSFVDYLKSSVDVVAATENYDFRYFVYPDTGYTAQEICDIASGVDGVTEAFAVQRLYEPLLVEQTDVSEEYLKWKEQRNIYAYEEELAREETGRDRSVAVARFYFLTDEDYIAYTEKNNLTGQGWFSEKKNALAYDGIRVELPEHRYTEVEILPEKSGVLRASVYTVLYGDGEGEDRISEGAPMELSYTTVEAEPPSGVDATQLTLVYPASALLELAGLDGEHGSISEIVYMSAEGSKAEVFERVKNVLLAQGISGSPLVNDAEQHSFERNLIVIINVFSYGFIVLISLIAAANVFNTISTNISLRRRELAMLESIGMTKKGLYRMLNYECLLYGIKSLCYGLPVAVLVTFAIYRVINEGYVTSFYIPAASILIAVFSVFAVVFATMFYAVLKLQKNSIVDTLKNENV